MLKTEGFCVYYWSQSRIYGNWKSMKLYVVIFKSIIITTILQYFSTHSLIIRLNSDLFSICTTIGMLVISAYELIKYWVTAALKTFISSVCYLIEKENVVVVPPTQVSMEPYVFLIVSIIVLELPLMQVKFLQLEGQN